MKNFVGLAIPVDTSVLLTRAADTVNVRERNGHGLGQSIKDEIYRFQPHGDGRINLACLLVDVDTLLDAIFAAKILVEIDLCFSNDLEV